MTKKRILHIDDERDTLSVVKTILEKEGFEVVGAESGASALKEIDANNFDLILIDVMMPDMSGWDLFSRIGKLTPNHNVIFLSVLEITEKKEREIRALGAKDYIKKPFDKDDFVARVKKALDL